MSDIDDILGKLSKPESEVKLDVDGMCDVIDVDSNTYCYFPYDYGIYDAKAKVLNIVCVKGHEVKIPWEMQDG